MESVLGIYDVTGIQNFIFNSNKLKENIGASIIVKETLNKYLICAIKTVARKNGIDEKDIGENWFHIGDDDFKGKFKDPSENRIEIVYIGGGNAVVAFSDIKYYNATTKMFALFLLEKTYSLNVASACTPITDNFNEDKRLLFLNMKNYMI